MRGCSNNLVLILFHWNGLVCTRILIVSCLGGWLAHATLRDLDLAHCNLIRNLWVPFLGPRLGHNTTILLRWNRMRRMRFHPSFFIRMSRVGVDWLSKSSAQSQFTLFFGKEDPISLTWRVGGGMRSLHSWRTWPSLVGNGLLLKRLSRSPSLTNGDYSFHLSKLEYHLVGEFYYVSNEQWGWQKSWRYTH